MNYPDKQIEYFDQWSGDPVLRKDGETMTTREIFNFIQGLLSKMETMEGAMKTADDVIESLGQCNLPDEACLNCGVNTTTYEKYKEGALGITISQALNKDGE